MSIKAVIGSKAKEELKKSVELRKLAIDMNISFDKAKEIAKKQDEAFKKSRFFKNLNRAMKDEGKNE